MTDEQLSADMSWDERGVLLRRITGERGQVLVMTIKPETGNDFEFRSDQIPLDSAEVSIHQCQDCSVEVGIVPRSFPELTVLCNSCCIRQGEL